MTQTVLILGATGRFGRHSAEAFAKAGWNVRKFNRSSDDMTQAAKGVDVIVNGLNPPNYHDWENILPQITRDVIAAAQASGATVILPGNVYHFGAKGGEWSEKTPPKPNSRKGQLRLTAERAYAQSGVQTIVLRGGNAVDPDLQGCVMALVYMRDIAKGKVGLPGGADVRQALCYLPDWARAAVALAEMRTELAQFEDIPFPGHTVTARQLKSRLAQIMNRDLKFAKFPWWAMRMAAPFWELARELNEMRYLWDTDHSLSADRFNALIPDFEATPLDAVLRSVLPKG